MISVIFREPTQSDLDALAANMRAYDRTECIAMGLEPHEALSQGVKNSLWAYAAEVDGQVVTVFGLSQADLLSPEAHPWMLCAEGIERHTKAVLVHTRRFLRQMHDSAETLVNAVHADNRTAIRFIQWCGFEMGARFEVRGEPFVAFEMKRAA